MEPFPPGRIGYFGKVMSTGDFVARNADPALRKGLDAWLTGAIAQSRGSLGDEWLNTYLTSPVWQYLWRGQFGQGGALAGVLIPSSDSSNRWFPFTLFYQTEDITPTPVNLMTVKAMLDMLETHALRTLDERHDMTGFHFELKDLAGRIARGPDHWPQPVEPGGEQEAKLHEMFCAVPIEARTIWWTEGSDLRSGGGMAFAAMPEPAIYARMLRDPDAYADFHALWERMRQLRPTMSDNGASGGYKRIGDRGGGPCPVVAASRPDTASGTNSAFALVDPHSGAAVVANGRFNTETSAMTGRFVCNALAPALAAGDDDTVQTALSRIIAYLGSKHPGAEAVRVGQALGVAAAYRRPDATIGVLCSDDLSCLIAGAGGLSVLFRTGDPDDEPTLRTRLEGLPHMFRLSPDRNPAVAVATPQFANASRSDIVADALAATMAPDRAARACQDVLLAGARGDLAVALFQARPPGR